MKKFRACLRQQLSSHSSMEPRDVVKLCYQAACGAEHLLSDLSGAWTFFEQEFASVPERDEPLFEQISENVCRMNLGAWKQTGMPSEWLFRMFTGTVFQTEGKNQLNEYLSVAETVLRDAGCDMEAWKEYITAYKLRGMPAVRHSERYRETETPAYRIVGTEYLRLLPILQKISDDTPRSVPYVIAVDGMAGAGKSTVAALLQKVLDAGAVYMDDFFLPPVMRSEERLKQAGGNVHYERFAEQVVPYVNVADAFDYDIFDCSCMDYHGKRTVSDSCYRIVEGSYAHHPRFGAYMNLRVFTAVEADEQIRRITRRNGEAMAEMFRTRWIPMENQYFDAYRIRESSDVCV